MATLQEKQKLSIYALTMLLVLSGVQCIFYVLQNTQAQSSAKSIQTLLRQEIASSNTFLIARTLSDLHETGLVRCVRLIEHQTQKSYLDLTYKDACGKSAWWLQGTRVVSEMKSLNGEKWEIVFETFNGPFFNLSLWLSRIIFGGMAALGLWLYFKRESQHQLELQKKEKLKELAEQAAHDVASPLSMLNALLYSNLVSDEAKEFIRLVKERVQGIVGNLKTQSVQIEQNSQMQVMDLNLTEAVSRVLKEARTRYDLIEWNDQNGPVMVKAQPDELYRVISNLVGNALEASSKTQKPIKVLIKAGDQISLQIIDQGIGIPKDKLPYLGSKGATFGKAQGSGLGLYHAKQCLKSWDGDLRIESEEGVGTKVEIIFEKVSEFKEKTQN